jgi:hypothetical protein
MRQTLLIIIFLFFCAQGFTQSTDTLKDGLPSVGILNVSQFERMVDRFTELIKSRKFEEISDSDNIFMIASNNTIVYSKRKIDNLHYVRRFAAERYIQFITIFSKEYITYLFKAYPGYEHRGMGIYFPKLKIQLGGIIDDQKSFLKVIDD